MGTLSVCVYLFWAAGSWCWWLIWGRCGSAAVVPVSVSVWCWSGCFSPAEHAAVLSQPTARSDPLLNRSQIQSHGPHLNTQISAVSQTSLDSMFRHHECVCVCVCERTCVSVCGVLHLLMHLHLHTHRLQELLGITQLLPLMTVLTLQPKTHTHTHTLVFMVYGDSP